MLRTIVDLARWKKGVKLQYSHATYAKKSTAQRGGREDGSRRNLSTKEETRVGLESAVVLGRCIHPGSQPYDDGRAAPRSPTTEAVGSDERVGSMISHCEDESQNEQSAEMEVKNVGSSWIWENFLLNFFFEN